MSNPRRFPRPWRLAVAVVLLAAPAAALDPDRAVTQYVLTKWGAGSLPGAGILSLSQTRDGYLWVGTAVGLTRFDGARFATFDVRTTRGLADGGISRLALGPDGTLFLGTTHGVTLRYADGTFSRVDAPVGAGEVKALLATRDGTLWVSCHGRAVQRVLPTRSHSLFRQIGPEVPLAMAEDPRGHVWMGTWRDGLVHYDGESYTRLPLLRDTVQALHIDRAGTFWIGTPHGLYRRTQDGALTHFTARDGLSHDSVSAILDDRDGNLWVGTRGGGVNRFRAGRFEPLGTRQGLSDDDVRCLLEDDEGNVWVGTADGLNSLSDGRFVTYGRAEGLPDTAVPSVAAGANGTVWIGTAGAGVVQLRDGKMRHHPLPSGIGREAVLGMYEDRRGALWITVENGRLFRLEGSALTEHTPRGIDPTWKVPTIFEDAEGPLFYMTHFGLARIQDRRLLAVHPHAPRFSYVHAIYRDAREVLWLGTARGLVRVENGEYEVFRKEEGLPHDRVRSIAGEADGTLWAATIGGLARMKDRTIRALTVEHGLPEGYLRLVLDDGLGHLWIASSGHVFRLDKREVHEVLDGSRREVTPILFDASDGLRTTEVILSNSPGARTADGRLWFATARGVSVVDPARFETAAPAPPVRIEAMDVDGETRRLGQYPPGRGEVSIDYTALRFRAAGKARFRYRLEGFDHGWVDAGTRRSAYYSNLPPGSYTFTVMASNRDGVWNGEPARLAFSLRPPFHQRPAFFVLSALAVLALAAFVHRLRVGQVRARFTATVAERTRIARELHDTLAQGLAGVGFQIDTALDRLPADPQLTRVQQHLQRARRMIRSSLSEVRRSIWVLRAQTSRDKDGFSQSLAESLHQLTADTPVHAELAVRGATRTLSAEVERSLLRVAHEAATNAVRHAGAGTLGVELAFEDTAVRLHVRDDGCGFDPDAALAAAEGQHFGLTGIVERVRALGGEARIESRPGAGTSIDCRIPYDCRVETAEVETIEGITL